MRLGHISCGAYCQLIRLKVFLSEEKQTLYSTQTNQEKCKL